MFTGVNISVELLVHILKWLPVKSLMRFMCVSKVWRSLISSPEFISLHNHRIQEYNHYIIFNQLNNREHNTCTLYIESATSPSIEEIDKFDFPSKPVGDFFVIMGCINGLIALWDGADSAPNTVTLWNPAIKKHVMVPEPPLEPHLDFSDFDGWDMWFGFGYDIGSDDPKVVRVLFFFECSTKPVASKADVFSVNSSSWRTVRGSPPFHVLGLRENQVYQPFHMNGIVHWLTGEPYIVTFDCENDVFGEIGWPTEVTPAEDAYDELSVCRGKFSLIRIVANEKIEIWVMTEYGAHESWTRHFMMDLGLDNISKDQFKHVAGFTRTGSLVMVGNNGGKLVSFDERREDPEVRNVKVEGKRWLSCRLEQYVESLVLLGGDLIN